MDNIVALFSVCECLLIKPSTTGRYDPTIKNITDKNIIPIKEIYFPIKRKIMLKSRGIMNNKPYSPILFSTLCEKFEPIADINLNKAKNKPNDAISSPVDIK